MLLAAVGLVVWVIGGSVVHVFRSADSSARKSRYLQSARALARTLRLYAGSNDDRLPGHDWKRQVKRIAPDYQASWREGSEWVSFAAMPGTLGTRLASLPDEKIVFALCRWDSELSVVDDPRQILSVNDPKWAIVLSAKDIREGYSYRRLPLREVIDSIRR